ncbi:isoamyl acetate-hydrolyzing esterase [Coemansia sp. RSA 1972]|nr:isoamyl acetate-hydrolyzing esterase [Coemansia sp. RSA 1972]
MVLSRTTVRILIAVVVATLFTFNYIYITSWASSDLSSSSNTPTNGDTTYEYPGYDVFLAFGDSITQIGDDPDNGGYLAYLTRHYERQMDVLNRGFAGYNTTGARAVVHRVFPKTRTNTRSSALSGWYPWQASSKPGKSSGLAIYNSTGSIWPSRNNHFPSSARKLQLCIIFFGANDAQEEGEYGHNPIENYAENLRYFVSLLRSPDSEHYSPDTRILFITPPASGELLLKATARSGHMPMFRNKDTKAYAEVVKKIATEVGAPYVDLYSAIENRVHPPNKRAEMSDKLDTGNSTKTGKVESTVPAAKSGKYDGYDQLLIDGIHLNPAGNKMLFNLVVAEINKNWPELKPSSPHVPLDEFYENLHKLVMLLRNPNSDYYSPDTRIVFITPPAVGDRMIEDVARRNGYEPDRKNAVTKLYADAVKKVAKEHDLSVVDIWTAIEDLVCSSTSIDSPDCKTESNVAEHDVPTEETNTSPFEGYEKYLLDGLHLNRNGNELLFRLIVSEIEKG